MEYGVVDHDLVGHGTGVVCLHDREVVLQHWIDWAGQASGSWRARSHPKQPEISSMRHETCNLAERNDVEFLPKHH